MAYETYTSLNRRDNKNLYKKLFSRCCLSDRYECFFKTGYRLSDGNECFFKTGCRLSDGYECFFFKKNRGGLPGVCRIGGKWNLIKVIMEIHTY